MIRVAVADDQALVRSGFTVLLRSADDIEVVGEAANGREAVDLVAAERPDVMLMDIRMPEMDGIEATRRIAASGRDDTRARCSRPSTSTSTSSERCAPARADSCSRTRCPTTCSRAVRVVAAGEALLAPEDHPPPDRAVRGGCRPGDPGRATTRARLTDRAGGRGPRRGGAAASRTPRSRDELFMAHATAKTHVSRLLTKLDCRDRAQLVMVAYEAGVAVPGVREQAAED